MASARVLDSSNYYSIVVSKIRYEEVADTVINLNNVNLYNSVSFINSENNTPFTNVTIDEQSIYIYFMKTDYFNVLSPGKKFIIDTNNTIVATDLMGPFPINRFNLNSNELHELFTTVINTILDQKKKIFDLNYIPPRDGGKRMKKRKSIKRKSIKRKSIKRKSIKRKTKKRRYTK